MQFILFLYFAIVKQFSKIKNLTGIIVVFLFSLGKYGVSTEKSGLKVPRETLNIIHVILKCLRNRRSSLPTCVCA